MAHPLAGARAKLRRAQEHHDFLHTEVRRWFQSHSKTRAIDIRRDGPWYIAVNDPGTEEPPSRWALIFGDAIQNIRTSLDYAVCDLITANTGQKPTDRNAFPIH